MVYQINKSNIDKISWENNKMRVYFTSGQIVDYQNMPEGLAVGMYQAPSAGSYMNNYICGKYSYKVIKETDLKEQLKELEHHKDTTIGLWATDRHDLIPENIKELFFEITYQKNIL